VPLAGRQPYPELIRFPAVVERRSGSTVRTRIVDPDYGAFYVTVSPTRVYALFAGHTRDMTRLIDTYDIESGAYIESFVFPHRLSRIAWAGGMLYVIRAEPYPSVEAWRPVGSELP